MKRMASWILALALTAALAVPAAGAVFTDVPAESSLVNEVQKAVDYGLMNGYSAETFGYADSMTRVQFLTVLDRMMGWSAGYDARVAMWKIPFQTLEISEDDLSDTYLTAIEEAVNHNVIDTDSPLRPNAPITRGEMSEMLVRALGLKSAAALAEKQGGLPFTDVTERKGYISVAYDIGMTKGTSAVTFAPNAPATRAQAAAMLVRIYEKLQREIGFVHGFYAISSYSQLGLAEQMDAVSAGWSSMSWDGGEARLITDQSNQVGYVYYIPNGYEEVTSTLESAGVPLNLNVFMDGQNLKDMLASADGRSQAVEQIIAELTVSYPEAGKNPYSGVTIDFEGLRAASREHFTAFLQELEWQLRAMDKSLYVCVSPVLTTGSYYDGYDYAAIGSLADRVILMAYDYDTRDLSQFTGTEYHKTAATAPIDQVYWSLKTAAAQLGDVSKLALGFSCKNVAWQVDDAGRLVSGTPVYPTNETVAKRLAQADTVTGWSDDYQQSWAVYTSEDGSRYFLWYQDNRSVETVLNAAKLLGVGGVSIWRLGNLPQYTIGDTVWNWSGLLD